MTLNTKVINTAFTQTAMNKIDRIIDLFWLVLVQLVHTSWKLKWTAPPYSSFMMLISVEVTPIWAVCISLWHLIIFFDYLSYLALPLWCVFALDWIECNLHWLLVNSLFFSGWWKQLKSRSNSGHWVCVGGEWDGNGAIDGGFECFCTSFEFEWSCHGQLMLMQIMLYTAFLWLIPNIDFGQNKP